MNIQRSFFPKLSQECSSYLRALETSLVLNLAHVMDATSSHESSNLIHKINMVSSKIVVNVKQTFHGIAKGQYAAITTALAIGVQKTTDTKTIQKKQWTLTLKTLELCPKGIR